MNTHDIYLQLLNSERPELADVMLDLHHRCLALSEISTQLLERTHRDLVEATHLL